jgi:hypothetical protein
MSISDLMSRLQKIEETASLLFRDQFNGMEDGSIDWVIAPLDQTMVNNLHVWLDMAKSDLTAGILETIFDVSSLKDMANWINGPLISLLSSRLNAASSSMQAGSETWGKICEARRQIILTPGGLNREDVWRFRRFTESAKDDLSRHVASVRMNLQEICALIASAPGGQDHTGMSVRCPITGNSCNTPILPDAKRVFVGFQFKSEHYKTKSLMAMINEAVQRFNLTPFFPGEHYEPVHISCEICQNLQRVSICIFEISDSNPNVMFELGLAYMLGKVAILLAKKGSPGTHIADIAGMHRIEYEDMVECRDSVSACLSDSTRVQEVLQN